MNYNIPVSNGLLTPEHRVKMGEALWVFLWLLDRTTKEQPANAENATTDGEMEGLVLGGSPITAARIGGEIGETARSVRNRLRRLEQHGYIRRIDHGMGESWGYVVTKSKKWLYSAKEKASGPLTEERKGAGGKMPGPITERPPARDAKTPAPLPKKYQPIRNTLQNNTEVTVTEPFALKPRDRVDPRRKDFIADLKKYREHLTPGKFMFTGKDGSNLDAWLREHPQVTRLMFRQCLDHRARSDVNPAEEIFRWIGRVLEYSEGPLDRYGKPKAGGRNEKNAAGSNLSNQKEQFIAEIGQSVLERRRAGRTADEQAGVHAEPSTMQAAGAGSD